MKLIVGLGNPGKKYEKTRHNSGFVFLDAFREYLGFDKGYDVGDWHLDKKYNAEICEAKTEGGEKVILFKPQTFMNLSGDAVGKYISMFKLDPEKDLILAHDDLDIALGKYKIVKGLSPKVHKGVKNVESGIGKINFLRVRLGVDSRAKVSDIPGEVYVTMKMSSQDHQILRETISSVIKDLRSILSL